MSREDRGWGSYRYLESVFKKQEHEQEHKQEHKEEEQNRMCKTSNGGLKEAFKEHLI